MASTLPSDFLFFIFCQRQRSDIFTLSRTDFGSAIGTDLPPVIPRSYRESLGLIVVGSGWASAPARSHQVSSKRPTRFCWRLVAQRGMWPDVVVVVSPQGQLAAGMRRVRKQSGGLFSRRMGQAVEDFLVQAFVPQAAVEAFDEAVLAVACQGRCICTRRRSRWPTSGSPC